MSGSVLNPPLDFYQFPRMLGDVSVLKKEVVGNPMYVARADFHLEIQSMKVI